MSALSPQLKELLLQAGLFLGIVGGWIVLQVWVLPAMGVET